MEKFKITREAKLRLDNWVENNDYLSREAWINRAIVRYIPEVEEEVIEVESLSEKSDDLLDVLDRALENIRKSRESREGK